MPATGSWRERLEKLDTLPIRPSLAMRFIELGKDPDSDINDYVIVAQQDASLSGKLLAVANSAWIGARHEIRTVKQAIGLLGTNNVRALAISYCLAGLHSVWKLPDEVAEAYWQASLCKAAAAEMLTRLKEPKRAEEAFTMALFQDIGIGLLAASAGEAYIARLGDPGVSVQTQLQAERELFDADHAECGRMLAEHLQLPPLFLGTIANHHSTPQLQECIKDDIVYHAVSVASLLSHDMRCWKPQDIEAIGEIVAKEYADHWTEVTGFVSDLQTKLASLISLLHHGSGAVPPLEELVREACVENARSTAMLVGQVQSLVTNNNNLAAAVSSLTGDQAASEMRANRDPLTGLLNREGFEKLSQHVLEKVARAKLPLGLALFDLDKFKTVNDTYGHACGDMLLKSIASRLRSQARTLDLICRWGGDEILVLLEGLELSECENAVQRLQDCVTRDPVAWHDTQIPLHMSVGLHWLRRVEADTTLVDLIERADRAMYEAKGSGRNRLVLSAEASASVCGAVGTHA